MDTVFDWLTLAAFAGLVVLYLQRSVSPEPSDHIWQYLPPSIGFAGSNWLGNNGYPLIAVTVLVASCAYIFYVLKPFASNGRR